MGDGGRVTSKLSVHRDVITNWKRQPLVRAEYERFPTEYNGP